MIRTEALTKHYGPEAGLDRLTVAVPRGSVVGVLGPNGAGKTTLLRLLVGLVRPTAGAGRVLGRDVARQSAEIRRIAALVPESKVLYAGVTVAAFLRFYASFFADADRAAALALLDRWGVAADRQADALSKGGRTKVLLSAALSRRPELMVLDEPSEGLDPGAVEDLWSMLMERVGREEGAGMILSTHRIDEAERVCDRVLVLDRGRLVLEGELDSLRSGWRRLILRSSGTPATIEAMPGVVGCRKRNGVLEATTSSWDPSISERLPTGVELLEARGMSLREIYLVVVGHDR